MLGINLRPTKKPNGRRSDSPVPKFFESANNQQTEPEPEGVAPKAQPSQELGFFKSSPPITVGKPEKPSLLTLSLDEKKQIKTRSC